MKGYSKFGKNETELSSIGMTESYEILAKLTVVNSKKTGKEIKTLCNCVEPR